jgi:hypothetical protein
MLLMDQILTEYADQAFETARLGRKGVHTARELVSAEMLTELEAIGDAMRYPNSDGQIAWKATPQLRDYLMDLQLDAETDVEDFETCSTVNHPSSLFQRKLCKRISSDCKMSGKQFKLAGIGMRSIDIWPPFLK